MSAGVVGTKAQQLILVALLLVAAVATGLFLAQTTGSEAGVHASGESDVVVVAGDGWEW
ncbi:hypothetical protein [Catenuloplanes indicus]|uniref:Pyruvate/2-oxoacid:ferredoxin oxidoreductase beta subunit n=1 Tax=Catenuloplanes indicus TaxID=137267 RepID=A0AAE4AYF8_9ACTN|nr:hypothetical protein [Catenuloplanes indicus]MDQ0367204.1 pyruvate/2-oxoacid:ferredoxin oxidoreductase beta subunit [Catenuloplanes indicus]